MITKSITQEKIADAEKGASLINLRALIRSFSAEQQCALSEREKEIVQQLALGKKRAAIAKEMYINIETVKSHIKSIYQKLNVHYKEDAVKIAREIGYIS